MTSRLGLLLAVLPLAALAQTEPPLVTEPVHPAVAVPAPLPNWNIGAGVGLNLVSVGLSQLAGGLGGLGGVGNSLGSTPQPRMTIVLERRLSEQLFLSFNAAASYGANQSDTYSALSSRSLTLDASVGLRRVLNPRGVIEVSLFGSAGVGYGNSEVRTLVQMVELGTGMPVQVPQAIRGNSFAVGAIAGLTLERELISGLALRLSTGVLGASYGSRNDEVTTGETSTPTASHGFDLGLRFNPAIELRYAF